MTLETDIVELVAQGASAGRVRAAEPDDASPTGWPVIVKYRDSRTDTRTELEAWIR